MNYIQPDLLGAYPTPQQVVNRRLFYHSGKTSEWYTPTKYIEIARSTMGGIDLDPASCALANETVKATHYFTVEDNGLRHAWWGRVWLNPPYSDKPGAAARWAAKLLASYQRGQVAQAILLVNLCTMSQRAMQELAMAGVMCIPNHRIRFHDAQGIRQGAPPQPNVFLYVGERQSEFVRDFGIFGMIHKAVQP
jgi:ParB family chromosome partitioning protein